MKLTLNPMARLRAEAIGRVNQYFNSFALNEVHKIEAYRRKKVIAQAVIDFGVSGAPQPFIDEATLRDLSPAEFAQQILDKPDVVDQRELERQKIMMRIDAATSADELKEAEKIDSGL